MGTLIGISSPQVQLRQNRSMLLLIASVSSLSGLLLWSASPFVFNNPKDKVQVVLRYLSLFGSLSCGVTAIVCGNQLQKINPLVKAIETAERNDFLEQLAVSQYQQQQQWQQMALAPTTKPPIQINQVDSTPHSTHIQPSNTGNSGNEAVTSVTKADSVNVSQDKQFNSVTDAGNGNGNANVTDGTEAYKPLYLAVTQMKEMGVSDSKIIKEVLGHEGRNFKQGQEMLEALLSLGQQHGW
jgi:hypothetical protein